MKNEMPENFFEEFHENNLKRLEEIEVKLKKEEERALPLPDKLYHVTTRANAREIMKEGLDPSKLIFEDRKVVSLSDDIDFAIAVVKETQNTTEGNLLVLEIDTEFLNRNRIENYLRKADPDNSDPIEAAAIHEVHYETTIPPEAMKIIDYRKRKAEKQKNIDLKTTKKEDSKKTFGEIFNNRIK